MVYYIIAVAVPLALLIGFLVLTSIEAASGVRMLGGVRRRLDRRIGQLSFIIAHVDLGSFARETVRAFFERVLHDLAHGTLVAVRSVERMLTRLVRHLRVERQEADPASPRRGLRDALGHIRRVLRLRRISIQERANEE